VHTSLARASRIAAAAAVASLALAGAAQAAPSDQYLVHNLTSSSAAIAADHVDPNLVNAWGLVASPTSPWWINDQATSLSTVYNAAGVPNPAVVVGVPTGPTGIVANTSTSAFLLPGGSASFVFATLSGAISAWRSGATVATTMATTPGASYTGLALANAAAGPRLYATDFGQGRVDVFDAGFQPVTAPGGFIDPNLPAGYLPYNAQAVGGSVIVTFAQKDAASGREKLGAGLGVVDAFDADGHLLARVATGGALDAPWGVAQAPAGFGAFAGDLLVGNFGDGRINAFAPSGGGYVPAGALQSTAGTPLVIPGLWALEFGSGSANSGPTSTLYFTAGPNGGAAGLFGAIYANPATISGSVGAQLALTLGAPASFGAFAVGQAQTYAAATTAAVTSTAASSTLTVADPDASAPGHLANGTFTLPQPLQADATSPVGSSAGFAAVGAGPTPLLSYATPVTNDLVTIDFRQAIGAGDALRTGDYAKTLTFTLSTTAP